MKQSVQVSTGCEKADAAPKEAAVLTEAAENYLKTILELQKSGPVHCVDVAAARGVTKASVTVAVQKLRGQGYVRTGVSTLELTDAGRSLAQRMHERSCFFTRLLQTAGVDACTADTDACRMEHALSDRSFEALKSCFEKQLV